MAARRRGARRGLAERRLLRGTAPRRPASGRIGRPIRALHPPPECGADRGRARHLHDVAGSRSRGAHVGLRRDVYADLRRPPGRAVPAPHPRRPGAAAAPAALAGRRSVAFHGRTARQLGKRLRVGSDRLRSTHPCWLLAVARMGDRLRARRRRVVAAGAGARRPGRRRTGPHRLGRALSAHVRRGTRGGRRAGPGGRTDRPSVV